MEWYGYNNTLAREKAPVLIMPASLPSASASAKILDTPRLGITSRHTMVRVVHDNMLCPYMYSAG